MVSHYSGFRNVGLSPPKSSNMEFFIINLPIRGQSPYGFLQKLSSERDSLQVRTLRSNFTVVALKMGLQPLKSPKLVIFALKFAPKGGGYILLSDFYKILHGGSSPIGPHNHANFYHCRIKMRAYGPQNRQKCYFFVKICP